MLFLLTGRDEGRHPHLFRTMFALRYEVYVRRRGWIDLSATPGMERDCFDGPEAVYLLLGSPQGSVIGGLRLLPTIGPHLLADVFPHMVTDGRIPRGKGVMELTRFFVWAPGEDVAVRRHLAAVCAAALIEYCLDRGIHRLTSVVDTFLLPLMREFGWSPQPLGPVTCYREGRAQAVSIEVTPEKLALTEAVRSRRANALGSLEPARMDLRSAEAFKSVHGSP